MDWHKCTFVEVNGLYLLNYMFTNFFSTCMCSWTTTFCFATVKNILEAHFDTAG
uniref:Uncharacterized protein n=1 Tax=Meloidogyne enterolobii TaxID=390850 RepID=A0A6V7VXB9_MELEN|nr:unnamed protein product [Meloidogyne enterolobii]